MYCPRCGQQANQESNFCARCGFRFTALQDAVTNGGLVPTGYPVNHAQYNLEILSQSPRQKGIRFGAKLAFFSLVLLPVFLAMSIMMDSPGPFLVPFSVLLAGVSWMLYSRLFLESGRITGVPLMIPGSPSVQMPPGSLHANSAPRPPQPATVQRNWQVNTGEMTPSSVTEHTTNFLDRE